MDIDKLTGQLWKGVGIGMRLLNDENVTQEDLERTGSDQSETGGGFKETDEQGVSVKEENVIFEENKEMAYELDDEVTVSLSPELENPVYGYVNGLSYFAFSQQGESHIRKGMPCQDRCAVRVINDTPLMVMAIADGVGSCALSDFGAAAAVESAVFYLETKLNERESKYGDIELDDKYAGRLLREVMQYAYESVEKLALDMEQLLYSFQSTLTVAIYDGCNLYFAHAGDDGIAVISEDGILELATTRHKGEEASSVYPLQSRSTWEFCKSKNVVAFVMATDGVLDAFVRGASEKNRIYYPFIEPAVTNEQNCEKDVENVCMYYYDYMQSENYRKAVTDDLTLAVVMNWNELRKINLPTFDIEVWNLETEQYEAKRRAALYPDPIEKDNEQKLKELDKQNDKAEKKLKDAPDVEGKSKKKIGELQDIPMECETDDKQGDHDIQNLDAESNKKRKLPLEKIADFFTVYKKKKKKSASKKNREEVEKEEENTFYHEDDSYQEENDVILKILFCIIVIIVMIIITDSLYR